MKLCFVASSGGHLMEILQLRELEQDFEIVLVTEWVRGQRNEWPKTILYVPQTNRKDFLCIGKLLVSAGQSLFFLLKEKPDVIISTGALSTIPVCLIGKFLRKKLIYIESFARTREYSLTGKLLSKIADHTIVQWEKLAEAHPDVIYGGPVF